MGKLAVKPTSHKNEYESQDSLLLVVQGLAARVPAVKRRVPELLKALHETLDGMDRCSIETRVKLQMHLVRVSSGLPSAEVDDGETMLSTEQAAVLMKCSRPYVAMLVDRKRLPGSLKTSGGHRKIPLSAVRAWIKDNSAATESSGDYKIAAKEAGMYDVPEKTYVEVSKRSKGAKVA